MYDVLYASIGGHDGPAPAQATSADLDLKNPWLFTDPVAWALYAHQGRLAQLEQDIQAYVMYQGQWSPGELQLMREIRRLVAASILQPKGSFGYLSPHPSAYRAASDGVLEVTCRKYHYWVGQDIIFEPWLARLRHPGRAGPVWIGRLQSVSDVRLCCDAFPRVGELCEKALAILRQTLPETTSRQTMHLDDGRW